jgi:hypothetical protein
MERDLSDCDSSLRDALLLFCVSSETFAKSLVIANIIDFDSNPHT